ncbi:MAG TPA: DUF4097 family beta strand repeat-containing protein [Pyrinomonadaceae bacterium]|jgi:hypothetical protein
MAERCKNCGTELLAGQRFCRMCGAPISESQREELPTKVFQGERQKGESAPSNTAPQSARPGTDPFSPFQQGTAPRTPAPQPQYTTPLYLPPDHASSGSRATIFIIIGLVSVALLAAILLTWNFRHSRTTTPRAPQAESGIPVPPEPPPPPGMPVAGSSVLDESEAVEKDHETTITKTYPLSNSATFSIKGVNGNVQIEGWDESEAEVTVIKRGGSIEDRKAVQVKSSHSDNLLSFETIPFGGGGDVDIRYEVKLPRGLRQVEIKTVNAGVKVSDMAGSVEVKAQNASVELEDVSGASVIKLVNGRIKASYDNKLVGQQELSTVNGKIEVELDDDIDATIDVHTVSGTIELDGDFGFKVEKKIVGQVAAGAVGSGGQPISIKTVNGPIVIAR